tara:strand:- start:544 stop:675 length:132 start_codon:yes stop_codon:yes gene_type:complete
MGGAEKLNGDREKYEMKEANRNSQGTVSQNSDAKMNQFSNIIN